MFRVFSRGLIGLAAGIAALAGAASAESLPGMRGIDHVAITVPNKAEAVRFLTEVLGCKAYFEIGPLKFDDDWMQVHINVDPRAEIAHLQMVRCGNGSNIEVFEYNAAGQNKVGPKNSDIGGHHIAFYVDDMDKAVAYLTAKGVKILGGPTPMTQGPIAGQTFMYFLAPWGMQMEVISYPQGMAYEKSADGKLWSPKDQK